MILFHSLQRHVINIIKSYILLYNIVQYLQVNKSIEVLISLAVFPFSSFVLHVKNILFLDWFVNTPILSTITSKVVCCPNFALPFVVVV